MKTTSSDHVEYTYCFIFVFILTFRTIYVHNMFSPCFEKIRASDKDLPVPAMMWIAGVLGVPEHPRNMGVQERGQKERETIYPCNLLL